MSSLTHLSCTVLNCCIELVCIVWYTIVIKFNVSTTPRKPKYRLLPSPLATSTLTKHSTKLYLNFNFHTLWLQ